VRAGPPPVDRRLRIAVLWLGQISHDTAGRTYLTELLGPLARQPGLDVELHLGDPEFEVPADCRAVRHRVPYALGPLGRILAEPVVAARLSFARYDVLLAPFNFLPPIWRGPSVLVQHNVLAFGDCVREQLSWLRALYRPRALARSLRRATETVVISRYLCELLLEHFPDLDPAHVRVVPYGVSTELMASAETARPPNAQATVVVVSALWPYKRVDQALRAFAIATEGRDAALLIAGPAPQSQRTPLEELASDLGISRRVRFLGNVPHTRLGALYASADVLLYPSDIESFGLPLLEAMMLGVPVVAKRIPGLLEIGGDAPFWVDSDATDEDVAAALMRILDDPALRAEHVAVGRARAESFTWERVAQDTATALRDAASRVDLPVTDVREEIADTR
jgi:glycosyltransferase involved in cell wall biosynthesis